MIHVMNLYGHRLLGTYRNLKEASNDFDISYDTLRRKSYINNVKEYHNLLFIKVDYGRFLIGGDEDYKITTDEDIF